MKQIGSTNNPLNGLSKSWTIPLVVSLVAVISACGTDTSTSETSTSTSESDDTSSAIESALTSVNSASSDLSQAGYSTASSGYSSFSRSSIVAEIENLLIPSASAVNSCGPDRFTPAMGSESCAGTEDDKTVLSVFDNCSPGRDKKVKLNGTIKLTFDASSTCDLWIQGKDSAERPTSGTLTRTTDGVKMSLPSGMYVMNTSADHENYIGETVGGGVTTTFGESSKSIEIVGMHREQTKADGSSGFDHSVRSLEPLVISEDVDAGTRTITSGKIQVDHNLKEFSVISELSGVTWEKSCCHPIDGSISVSAQDKDGNVTDSRTLDFNTGTCGTVSVTKSDGSVSSQEFTNCDGLKSIM